MPTSKDSNESRPNSADTVGSDTIILSSTEQNTPAALVVDKNGILDIDELSSVIEEQHQTADTTENVGSDEAKPEKPKRKPVDEFLRLFRKPEQWLIDSYYNSALHLKLTEKFDWYNEIEDNQRLRNRLENLYGGTYNPLSSAVHFIRNNILVSLVLITLSGQLFVSYLSMPATNRYSDLKRVVAAENSSTSTSLAVAYIPGAKDYSTQINHCAVSVNLRQVLDDAKHRAVKPGAINEIAKFIQAYKKSDLEKWFTTRARKREIVVSYIQATLPRIKDNSTRIVEEFAHLTEEYNNKRAKFDGIDLTTTSGVNQSIRLRDELLDLEFRMRHVPSVAKAFSMLNDQLLRLENITSENAAAPPSGMSRWAITTSQQDLPTLTTSIGRIIENDIYFSIDQASQGNSATKLYKLQILAATLRDFGDLITQLADNSSHMQVSVIERQNSSNNRLRELLGYKDRPDISFLDYDNCLTALNTSNAKLSIR